MSTPCKRGFGQKGFFPDEVHVLDELASLSAQYVSQHFTDVQSKSWYTVESEIMAQAFVLREIREIVAATMDWPID